MKLSNYRLIFAAVCLIGVLLIASPALAEVIRLPGGEAFSELFLLGPEKTAQNIPFDIETAKDYTVYLGAGNHLGASAHYLCYIKLRNQTDSLPNEETATPSSLDPLYEYQVVLQDDMNWTAPLTFSLSNLQVANNQSVLESITINDLTFDVHKAAVYDQENDGYYYQLLVELWAFNPSSHSFEYQNRFVYFWLKAA
jgi:hypothetical protein